VNKVDYIIMTVFVVVVLKAEAAAEAYPSDVSDDMRPDDVHDDADDVDNDVDSDVHDDADDDRSCLGVRRRCLIYSSECNRALSDHRRYCRESSRLLHCSADEWSVHSLHFTFLPLKLHVFCFYQRIFCSFRTIDVVPQRPKLVQFMGFDGGVNCVMAMILSLLTPTTVAGVKNLVLYVCLSV